MSSKTFYTGFSFFAFLRSLLLRLACVVALVAALAHYQENPVVIVVFSIFCLFCILFLGDDYIVVREDSITQVSNSFAEWIFGKPKSFTLAEIQKAYLHEEVPPTLSETTIVVALIMLLPRGRGRQNQQRPIYLHLRSGQTIQLMTDLDYDQREKIVALVNANCGAR